MCKYTRIRMLYTVPSWASAMIADATVGAIPINEAKSILDLNKISKNIEKKIEIKNQKNSNIEISKNIEKSGYFNMFLDTFEKGFNSVLDSVDGLASKVTQNTPIGTWIVLFFCMFIYVFFFIYMCFFI